MSGTVIMDPPPTYPDVCESQGRRACRDPKVRRLLFLLDSLTSEPCGQQRERIASNSLPHPPVQPEPAAGTTVRLPHR